MTGSILTVTLNPALDVTTTTKQLLPQQKLRCDAPRYDAGGGGANVSRAIKELGGDSLAFVALGGATGVHYHQLLDEAGIDSDVWPLPGETRTSMTVMEHATGLHYRFVLPGPHQAAEEGERILAGISQILPRGFRFVVGSGGLPPGIAPDFYGRLAALARGHGASLILDTHGDALRSALPFRPYLIRLNHHEALELVPGSSPYAAAHTLADDLIAQGAAEAVIITLGEEGALVRSATETARIRPPKVVVRSAVGAGDSFVAALTLGLSRGWPLEKAARYGVAAAASAVTGEATDLCRADQVEHYFEEISGKLEPAA
jgi:6-phosphofructokinase 2